MIDVSNSSPLAVHPVSGNGSSEHGVQPRPEPNGSGLPRREKTVLVLGGGGMRGLAHVGVLRAVRRLGIRVDEIVGTSIGAILGSLTALGRTPEQIEEISRSLGQRDFFRLDFLRFLRRGWRCESVYSGHGLRRFLRAQLGQTRFQDLPLPFTCTAVAVSTGATVTFGMKGLDQVSVADAVYASCTLPGVFEPLRIGDERYFDGGIVDSCPIRIARARGATRILAVDLAVRTQREPVAYKPSLPFLFLRAFEILEASLLEQYLHESVRADVVLVQPEVAHHGRFDFRQLSAVVETGERATEAALASPSARALFGLEASTVSVEHRGVIRPRIDEERCVHCGLCVSLCPTEAYGLQDGGPFVAKPDHHDCRRDAACERHCPSSAIRLENL